ncbi:hypothetical protein Tco_0542972 [Tanacetum coccineum]
MVRSSTYEVANNCSSEDGIVEFVTDATKDSALLLSRIYKHYSEDSTLITYVKSWVTAQNICLLFCISCIHIAFLMSSASRSNIKNQKEKTIQLILLQPFIHWSLLKNKKQPSCAIGSCGLKGRHGCITYISEALKMLKAFKSSDEDTNATKQIIDEAKRVAESDNPFAATLLYYNLAEIMVAKGLIFENLNLLLNYRSSMPHGFMVSEFPDN